MNPEPDTTGLPPAPLPPDEALVAAFEQRVLTRDEPKVIPLRFDPASVQQRLQAALRQRLPRQRDPRRLHKLAVVCYGFVPQPTRHSTDPALYEALACTPACLLDVWAELRTAGLVERFHQGRARYYRLTRAGEDWLLSVVKGQPLSRPSA